MSGKSRRVSGRCLCGAVVFSVDGPLQQIVVCHCGMCRRQTGSTYPCTTVWAEHLSFGERRGLQWYRSSAGSRRGFCNICGSALFFEDIGSDRTSIVVGALDDPGGLAIAAHIYVADKPGWYAIADEAPQHAASGVDVPMPPKD